MKLVRKKRDRRTRTATYHSAGEEGEPPELKKVKNMGNQRVLQFPHPSFPPGGPSAIASRRCGWGTSSSASTSILWNYLNVFFKKKITGHCFISYLSNIFRASHWLKHPNSLPGPAFEMTNRWEKINEQEIREKGLIKRPGEIKTAVCWHVITSYHVDTGNT